MKWELSLLDANWQKHEQNGSTKDFTLFENLTLILKGQDRIILNKQTLAIKPGEIVVLMGPSGVGKSILADVTFDLKGRTANLEVDGKVGTASKEGALVFQEGGGLPHLTVVNNLRIISSNRKEIDGLAKEFSLSKKQLKQPASSLSGGERRRIAVAMSVLAKRRFLWLDEPEAGLDLHRTQELGTVIKDQAKKQEMGIVVTTHNVDFARDIANRILFFNTSGKLVSIFPESEFGVKRDSIGEYLATLLKDSIGETESTGKAEPKPKRTKVDSRTTASTSEMLLNCLTQMTESVPWLASFLLRRHMRSTLFGSFGLAWWRGALYYPFIGAIFALVLVLTFESISKIIPFVTPRTIIDLYGPEFVLRFVPPISAILIASAAGSSIASWVGQMSAERHLDSLNVLGVRTQRKVLGPAWWGLFVASVMHACAFGLTIVAVFVLYVDNNLLEKYGEFLQTLKGHGQYRIALSKVVGYGAIVASVVIGCAGSSLRTSSDVSFAITRSIVWCSIIVMTIELIVVSVDLYLDLDLDTVLDRLGWDR